ncbi:Hydrogenase expression/formation protein HypE [Methylacidimicrobium cyclopophantes]|uniref:Hydrogenase expression/formation protein HypE n=1 Tax=Methylacidimicrobium cyclopophantes TaxID=1041766 RepID=A0A5E6MAS3_9BACT|nr:hydrogenase expression/formation protein HypE [Methylacidimicrobium cyclopophantes]VVM06299.1 Hydrogenase expression/formation protein HypE [Methylacidimicrobium cyclopophantes]
MNPSSDAIGCPLPKLDFSEIQLGHGSGGVLMQRLLEPVFGLFSNPVLDERHDGAVVSVGSRIAITTDSFVVSPIFFPGGDIGRLAVHGTVNDLAMCGARPRYLALGLILEEGLPVGDLWRVLCSIRQAADECSVAIVTGDTKVVERGKGDRIFLHSTGVGELHPEAAVSARRIEAGDRILLNGPVGAHGIAILSVREGVSFESAIKSDSAPLHRSVLRLLERFGGRVHFLRDATRGGVATVLAEAAQQGGKGIEVEEAQIPVEEEVGSACEILGLDPLYVANEGRFLAVVASEIAEEALAELRRSGWPKAAVIGTVGEEHPGKALLWSRIGGRRPLPLLPGEQLPRIC